MISIDALMQSDALTNGRTMTDILSSAYQRIQDPSRWTQNCYARNSERRMVKPIDPSACCWCLLGAIAVESNGYGFIPPTIDRYLTQRMAEQYESYGFSSLGEMNDYFDHATVLQFLQSALVP